MALNAKQRLFVKFYLIEANATKAAKLAGYSAASAKTVGPRLLENAGVAQAIAEGQRRQERVLELVAIEAGITKERWLKELGRIAFTSIDDVATVDKKGKVHVIPTAERAPVLGHTIKKISGGKYGPSLELHSKQAALDTLGRSYGWVKDQVELSGKDGAPMAFLRMPSNGKESKLYPSPATATEAEPPVKTDEKKNDDAGN